MTIFRFFNCLFHDFFILNLTVCFKRDVDECCVDGIELSEVDSVFSQIKKQVLEEGDCK